MGGFKSERHVLGVPGSSLKGKLVRGGYEKACRRDISLVMDYGGLVNLKFLRLMWSPLSDW